MDPAFKSRKAMLMKKRKLYTSAQSEEQQQHQQYPAAEVPEKCSAGVPKEELIWNDDDADAEEVKIGQHFSNVRKK